LALVEILSGSDEIADNIAQTEQFDDSRAHCRTRFQIRKKGGEIDIDEEIPPKFSPPKRRQAIVDSEDEGWR